MQFLSRLSLALSIITLSLLSVSLYMPAGALPVSTDHTDLGSAVDCIMQTEASRVKEWAKRSKMPEQVYNGMS